MANSRTTRLPLDWLDLEAERDRVARYEKPAGLLVLSQHESDHIALDRILRTSGREVYYAYTCGEAAECMDAHRVFLIFCDRDLPACGWKDMLGRLARQPHAPLLVVSSRRADEQLWTEVLNSGGFDVLLKPFNSAEVRWVVDAAEQAWLCQAKACVPEPDPLLCCGLEPFVLLMPGFHEQS